MSPTEERRLDNSYPPAEFRYSPVIQTLVRAAGTAALFGTVSFECPDSAGEASKNLFCKNVGLSVQADTRCAS